MGKMKELWQAQQERDHMEMLAFEQDVRNAEYQISEAQEGITMYSRIPTPAQENIQLREKVARYEWLIDQLDRVCEMQYPATTIEDRYMIEEAYSEGIQVVISEIEKVLDGIR